MSSISIDDLEIPTIEGVIDNLLFSFLHLIRPLIHLFDFLGGVVNHSSRKLDFYLGWSNKK
jgi:hypothetical protein